MSKRAREPPPNSPCGTSAQSALSPHALNALLCAAPTSAALLSLTLQHGARFSPVNLATALHRLARFPSPPPVDATAALCALSTAVQQRSPPALNARTFSALLFASGELRLCTPQHLAALSRTAGAYLASQGGAADCASLSTLLHCMAKLDWTPHPQHLPLSALCAAAAAAAQRMPPLELSTTALAAARCRLRHPPLWAALAAAAAAAAPRLAPQGVATLAWSFAKARLDLSEAQGAALGGRALQILEVPAGAPLCFSLQDLSYLAFALSRGGGGPRPSGPLWAAIATRLTAGAPAQPRMPAASLFPLLAALSSGEQPAAPGSGAEGEGLSAACAALLRRAADALCAQGVSALLQEGLTGNDLGVLCTALLRGFGPAAHPQGEARRALAAALQGSLEASAAALSWRSVGVGDAAVRHLLQDGSSSSSSSSSSGSSGSALRARALACVQELAVTSDAANAAPGRLFEEWVLKAAPGALGTCVLLCGRDPGGLVQAALSKHGIAVHTWARFAEEGEGKCAAPWPTLRSPASPPFSAAVLRWPSSREDFEFMLHAAASCVPAGAAILVLACSGERVQAQAAESALLASPLTACMHSSSADGTRLFMGAFRTPLPLPSTLERWQSACTLASPVFSPPHAWTTYPGLFAGGRLDTMSSALLNVAAAKAWLQPPLLPPGSHLLDAFCGSGALAAGALRLAPSLHLTLCDADALALQAAQHNLPAAALRACHCSHGIPPALPLASFACILSNPPVHAGVPDDLRALAALCHAAPSLLCKGGALMCVAQAQVAGGGIVLGQQNNLGGGGGLVQPDITQVLVGEGKFIVWRIIWSQS